MGRCRDGRDRWKGFIGCVTQLQEIAAMTSVPHDSLCSGAFERLDDVFELRWSSVLKFMATTSIQWTGDSTPICRASIAVATARMLLRHAVM